MKVEIVRVFFFFRLRSSFVDFCWWEVEGSFRLGRSFVEADVGVASCFAWRSFAYSCLGRVFYLGGCVLVSGVCGKVFWSYIYGIGEGMIELRERDFFCFLFFRS